jgi:DNA-binding IclR family transcriptional regulator
MSFDPGETLGKASIEVKSGIESAVSDWQATGACTVYGEYHRHAWGIALPLRVGHLRMALGCGAIAPDVDLDELRQRVLPALLHTAAEMRRTLNVQNLR